MGTGLFGEQHKMKLCTYLFSATVTAAGCSLIERSAVTSQAAAALKRVLGPDAKLLSKNVQLLPLVLLRRVSDGKRKTPQNGCFSAVQLPPKVEFADRMLKWKRGCVTPAGIVACTHGLLWLLVHMLG